MKPHQISVTSELYEAGINEEGRPYTAEVYIVVAELPGGMRYANNHHFRGCVVHTNDEDGGVYFEDVREAAMTQAEELVAHIMASGSFINLAHWYEYTPVYGSAAYEEECQGMTKRQLAGEE